MFLSKADVIRKLYPLTSWKAFWSLPWSSHFSPVHTARSSSLHIQPSLIQLISSLPAPIIFPYDNPRAQLKRSVQDQAAERFHVDISLNTGLIKICTRGLSYVTQLPAITIWLMMSSNITIYIICLLLFALVVLSINLCLPHINAKFLLVNVHKLHFIVCQI